MKLPRILLGLALLASLTLSASAQVYTRLYGITDDDVTKTGITMRLKTRQVSAAYTVTATNDHTILADATSAAFQINLPAAGTNLATKIICIQKTDSSANAITIDGSGTEAIDGSTTYVLRNQYQSVLIQAGFGSWHILGQSQTGGIGTLTAGATPAFAPFGTLTTYTLTPGEAETIAATTTYAVKGREYALIVLTSGTTSYTLTFGSNFKSTGTLATGTTSAKYFVVRFIYNGTYFIETSRTTAQ